MPPSKPRRPDYVPAYLDWWPGEKVLAPTYTIREATQADVTQCRRLFCAALGGRNLSSRTILRLLTQHGYTLRLACRNRRYAVAVCAARHTAEANTVLLCHAADRYRGKGLERKLLALASAEVPEAPTLYRVAEDDEYRHGLLRASDGWRLIRGAERDGDGGVREYARAALLKRNPDPDRPGVPQAARPSPG
jgi:hypothetical protein